MSKKIPGENTYNIVSLYNNMNDYIFKVYNTETNRMLRVTLPERVMWRWFKYNPLDVHTPPILRKENRQMMYEWLIDHLYICTGCHLDTHREIHATSNRPVLMYEYERVEYLIFKQRALAASKIQGMFRARAARKWFR